jgi:hypothetical protein
MNNIVPFQLPEASLTVPGWNLAFGMPLSTLTELHYSRWAKKKVFWQDLFQNTLNLCGGICP